MAGQLSRHRSSWHLVCPIPPVRNQPRSWSRASGGMSPTNPGLHSKEVSEAAGGKGETLRSGQVGLATDLLIRSISILTPFSPSSALLPNSLSGEGSSSNSVMGGRKQVVVSARVRVTEWGNSLSFPCSSPNE